jgi:peroxiredoxin
MKAKKEPDMTMPFTRGLKVIGAAGFALAFCAGATLASPSVGKPAPDFTGVDTKGQKVKLSDLRGKTVILEWTNDGCPYVQKHYRTGNMQALQKELTGEGIVWLSVISSSPGTQGYVKPAEADELTKSRKAAPTTVLLDPKGTIGRLYDAQVTPHMYIIKPDGTLAYKGAIDNKPTTRDGDIKTAKNYVKTALNQIAAGKPVDPAVTRAYGCTVKYPGS